MSENLAYCQLTSLIGGVGWVVTFVAWVAVDIAADATAVVPMMQVVNVMTGIMTAVAVAVCGYYETVPRQEGLQAARYRKHARWLSRAFSASVTLAISCYGLSRIDTIADEVGAPVSGWSIATWMLVVVCILLYAVYTMTLGDVKRLMKTARVQ